MRFMKRNRNLNTDAGHCMRICCFNLAASSGNATHDLLLELRRFLSSHVRGGALRVEVLPCANDAFAVIGKTAATEDGEEVCRILLLSGLQKLK